MRAISTVADVTLCLLLVGGAIGTLVAGTGTMQSGDSQPAASGNPAAEDAALLATTTATVNYSMAPATESPEEGVSFHRTEGPAFRRTAHGTLASLLSDAAVGNATVEDESLSHAGDEFERNLSSTVRDRLGRRGVRTSVHATWEPYPGAPVGGEIGVGEDPPRDVDVHAATLAVDSGVPSSDQRARRAARTDGYRGVARVVADSIVRGLFPPDETRLALRGEYPVDTLTAQRYRRTARVLDAGPLRIGETNVSDANDRLRVALARRLEADLTGRYDAPEAAARAVDTDTVDITVRTWSP